MSTISLFEDEDRPVWMMQPYGTYSVSYFFYENAKSFAFRCIDRKERVFTYVLAQKSQHHAEQINPIDLNRGGDQSTNVDHSSGCPRANLVTDRGRVRGCGVKYYRNAKLPNPPCGEHDQR
jgi:hypothetical protein